MGDCPLLKCVTLEEGNYILREVHRGICGSHIGTNALLQKVMRYGYFWPTIREDSKDMVQACHQCQIHSNDHLVPQNEYHSIMSPIPFTQWRMDLLGPFPKACEEQEYLTVAVNYFTRWIEAKPLSYITSKQVQDHFGKISFAGLVYQRS